VLQAQQKYIAKALVIGVYQERRFTKR